MIRKPRSSAFTSKAVLVVILIGVGVLSWLAIAVWPAFILSASGVELKADQDVDRLRALSDIRTALMTGLAGLAAATIAYAALWQANGARIGRDYQRELDWVNSYAAASSKLSDPSGPARFSGVVALESLVHSGGATAAQTIRATLAEYIRTRATHDPNDQSVGRAITLVCDGKSPGPYSLAGSDLTKLDLTGLSFANVALRGASVRNAKISDSQRSIVMSNDSLDSTGVEWIPN